LLVDDENSEFPEKLSTFVRDESAEESTKMWKAGFGTQKTDCLPMAI
jgi:hypothetical protein